MIEIYKSKVEYASRNGVHIQTANKREKIGRIRKLTLKNKKVGYIDMVEISDLLKITFKENE